MSVYDESRVPDQTGKTVFITGVGPTKRHATAPSAGPAEIAASLRDEDVALRLWKLSTALTGVSCLDAR